MRVASRGQGWIDGEEAWGNFAVAGNVWLVSGFISRCICENSKGKLTYTFHGI